MERIDVRPLQTLPLFAINTQGVGLQALGDSQFDGSTILLFSLSKNKHGSYRIFSAVVSISKEW
jgi:hypothetical protein